jgi:hypothetical protein
MKKRISISIILVLAFSLLSTSVASAIDPDTEPPELSVSVSPEVIFPPNHKMVEVTAIVTVTDNMDPDPTLTLVSITSNQPDNGIGDGNTIDDIVVINDYTFNLRAEYSGKDGDRIYTVNYQATDDAGNTTDVQATVTVPRMRPR